MVEKGDFDWKSAGKFPEITEPDLAYHGVNFWDAFGDHDQAAARGLAFVLKVRTGLLRDLGAAISPFNSFLFIQGLETLPLRAGPTVPTPWPWRSTCRFIQQSRG